MLIFIYFIYKLNEGFGIFCEWILSLKLFQVNRCFQFSKLLQLFIIMYYFLYLLVSQTTS